MPSHHNHPDAKPPARRMSPMPLHARLIRHSLTMSTSLTAQPSPARKPKSLPPPRTTEPASGPLEPTSPCRLARTKIVPLGKILVPTRTSPQPHATPSSTLSATGFASDGLLLSHYEYRPSVIIFKFWADMVTIPACMNSVPIRSSNTDCADTLMSYVWIKDCVRATVHQGFIVPR